VGRPHVLLIHNYYRFPGGEDKVFLAEAALLRKYGHTVTEYTRHNEEIEGLSKPALAAATLFNRSVYHDLSRLIRSASPDIVHIHNTLPLISPAAHLAAHAEQIPVVQTLHNYRLFCPQGLFWRDGKDCDDCVGTKLLSPSIRYGCYRGSRLASSVLATTTVLHRLLATWETAVDAFITPSEFSRAKLVQCGLDKDRITVKPHFIDPDPGTGSGGGGYGLFVGRLSPEKGLRTLLSAIDDLGEQVPIWIAGQGPLEQEVRDAAANNRTIRVLGHRTGADLAKIVGEASFVVVPSTFFETFGMVVIEAFVRGTPVIASRIGALTELVENGKNGLLFRASDSRELAERIRWFVSNSDCWSRMRAAARQSYEHRFAAQSNYEELLDIYGNAMESNKGKKAAAPLLP
jgi:glycosyltransferase involved in cell wall biosynthesis